MLALPRLSILTLLLPFFSPAIVPGLVRNAILFSLAAVSLPLVATQFQSFTSEMGTTFLILLALKEAVLGVIGGFILGLGFYVPQAIGDFIDNQRGSSLESLLNPATSAQSSSLGLLLQQVTIAWFIISGGIGHLFGLLLQSYIVFPITEGLPELSWEFFRHFLDFFEQYLHLCFLLSAPIIFSMLIAEIGLGLVGRYAPQLNVFFLAMPIKSVIGIALLIVFLNFIQGEIKMSGIILTTPESILKPISDAPTSDGLEKENSFFSQDNGHKL